MLPTPFRTILAPLAGAAVFAVAPLAAAQEAPGQVQPVPAPPPAAPTVIVQQYQPPPVYQQPMYGQPVYGQPVYGQPVMVAPGGYGVAQPYQYQPHVIKDWDESRPIPAGYHAEERVRKGLVIGGAVTFGTMYFLTALGAAVASDASNGIGSGGCSCGALFIPGVGPFIFMPQTNSATADVLLVVDGLAQLGGIAMFIGGLASPTTVLVRNEALSLKVEPIVGKEFSGTALVGRF